MEAWLAAALRFVILVIARGSVAQGFLGRRLGFGLGLQFCLGLAKLGEPSLFVSHPLRHLIAAPVRPINLVLSGVRRLGVFEPRIHFGCSSASGPSYTRRSCPTKYPRCVTWKPWRASGIEKRPVTVPASRIVRTPPSRDAISRSRCAFERRRRGTIARVALPLGLGGRFQNRSQISSESGTATAHAMIRSPLIFAGLPARGPKAARHAGNRST